MSNRDCRLMCIGFLLSRHKPEEVCRILEIRKNTKAANLVFEFYEKYKRVSEFIRGATGNT